DPRVVEDTGRLPRARGHQTLLAPSDGYVVGLKAEGVGMAAVVVGAGRERMDSKVDPAVGFRLLRKVGDPVRRGEPLAEVVFNDEGRGQEAARRLLSCYSLAKQPPPSRPLVLEAIG